MTELFYFLAILGAYRVVRRIVIIGHWFWKTRGYKPSPGLFGQRSPMHGLHG